MSKRDRERTEKQIIDAVARLASKSGFGALGINAIAREAGVDKVLIYRYFGGLPELLEAFAKAPEYWSSYEEMAGGEIDELKQRPLSEQLATVINGMANSFRKRPLSLEAMAWETVEANELTRVLAQTREKSGRRLLDQLGVKKGDDLDTAFVLLSGAVLYLAMLARHESHFGGIPIQSARGWKRIERGVESILQALEHQP